MTNSESMEGGVRRKAPVHLWIVGIVTLLWNAMGAFDYLATQLKLEFYMGQFDEAHLAYFYGFPKWFVAAWAFGVWGAVAGSVGLLLRKKWAMWAFGASLAGLFFSSIYTYFLSNGAEIMGAGGNIFTFVIWVAAICMFLYARAMAGQGVLN
jgi:hypothetical protein